LGETDPILVLIILLGELVWLAVHRILEPLADGNGGNGFKVIVSLPLSPLD